MIDYMTEDRESGFSLVELLVVIVIIGILSSIAVGAFLHQRKKANDAAVESDMRNVAITYETWRADRGNDNEKFKELAQPGSRQMMFVHEDADYLETSATVEWNSVEGLPQFYPSEGVFVMLNLTEADGDRTEVDGEYCLVGTHPNSSYDYEAGSASPGNYDHNLFYDSTAGGLMEMETMVEKYNGDPQSAACYKYVERYKSATGS